jgi:epoxyqueuosine reductase QueG
MQPDHPTIKWYEEEGSRQGQRGGALESAVLRNICLEGGADDVGFVEIDRPALSGQKAELLELMPETRTIVSLAFRVNRENVRTSVHSVGNAEFRYLWMKANNAAHRITTLLELMGIRALSAPAGFPFEAERWPGKMWLTSDKLIAQEAGLGRMGWNRLVLHPEFGAFVALGTLLLDVEVSEHNAPLDYNPCIECKLCVAACPTGAVGTDGVFSFPSCYTHNYRERLGGFVNWVETLVQAKSVGDYRARVSDSETVSMWQNLSIGAQTKCDRCVAVCPAGKQVIGDYLQDRAGFVNRTVKRFRDKKEVIYVVKGSDAEAHVQEHFSHKTLRRVKNGTRPASAQAFLWALPRVFQRNRSAGLDATFHFVFSGAESLEGTVIIKDKKISFQPGLVGDADLRITADSRTWVQFLGGEKNLVWAMLTRKVRVKGPMSLMKAFAACFPS